ncbi:hypothetical protein D9M68_865440 [compost metagenome]
MHRLLHRGVEVLHAEAQAVEAQTRQRAQALFGHGARIHLDRILTARHQREMRAQHAHEVFKLAVRQEGRCAAAQVQLRHVLARTDVCHLQLHLKREVAQVLGGAFVVLGEHLVTGAVVADRFAERNVHVQR